MLRPNIWLRGKIVSSAHHADCIDLIQNLGTHFLSMEMEAAGRQTDIVEAVEETLVDVVRTDGAKSDMNIGMPPLKGRYCGRQYAYTKRWCAGQAEQSGAGAPYQGDRLLNLLQAEKVALHCFEQFGSLGRGSQSSSAEFEKPELRGRLDLRQEPADRRLGGVKHFCGSDRGPREHDGPKRLDLAKIEWSRHRNSLGFGQSYNTYIKINVFCVWV